MDTKTIISSKEFQAVEHAVKVAAYIGAAGFLTALVTDINTSRSVSDLIAKNPTDALAFMLINMVLAGAVKYVNLHKAEAQTQL